MKINRLTLTLVLAVIVTPAWATPGTVLKFSQKLGHVIEPGNEELHGENIPSDVDWNLVMDPTLTQPAPPNWIIADDFVDPFETGVFTVRWWGSYFGDPNDPTGGPTGGTFGPDGLIHGPGSEDGYVISFFSDRPASPDGSIPSQPEELLATYVANLEDVEIRETEYFGWDGHRIWDYRVNLQDTHVEHVNPNFSGPAGQPIADQESFNQKPEEVYWIAINAQVGHKLDPATWEEIDTGKFASPNNGIPEGHFWGWHTSPENFGPDDFGMMNHLLMPDEATWEYPVDGWQPIEPRHGLDDMAFELYTIPEPASFVLFGLGVLFMIRRKNA